jgi:hypothetical protein
MYGMGFLGYLLEYLMLFLGKTLAENYVFCRHDKAMHR